MANLKNNARKPSAPSANVLIRAVISDLRRIASNSKGKMKYLEDLDKVLEEIYGVKGIGSRFCSGKKSEIDKVMKRIDFKSLVLMIQGSVRGTKGLLELTVGAHANSKNSYDRSADERKEDRKSFSKACKRLRTAYHIEKYRDPSKVTAKDLKDFLKQNDDIYDYDYDGYGYGYDDDDDYDYDDYSSREAAFGCKSEVEKLFDAYKQNNGYYSGSDYDIDIDDDDDDEIRQAISSGDLANERINELSSRVINPMINKIDENQRFNAALAEKLDRFIDSLTAPAPNREYVPLPKETISRSSSMSARPINNDPQLNAIASALTSINQKVTRTDTRLASLTEEVNRVNDVVRGIVNDVYSNDDDDYEDDGEPTVSMDAVNAAFAGMQDAEEPAVNNGFRKTAEDIEPASPISLKNMPE